MNDAPADAVARWASAGVAQLPGVLPAGLAAELLMGLRRLPLAIVEAAHETVWAYDVAVPPVRDPQLFEPLFRLVPILDELVPQLASAVCGRGLVAHAPTTFRVVAYRKGSWTAGAVDAPAGMVVATIALSAETWPDAWGGHPAEGWAATGALTLADAARARAVPVLTRHVERYELRTLLAPAVTP
ncbi:MAG: hypothetical protein JNK64_10515 [Myxococcales bacterium]|nr:hypothetical protein [Myxococcales bacterium]